MNPDSDEVHDGARYGEMFFYDHGHFCCVHVYHDGARYGEMFLYDHGHVCCVHVFHDGARYGEMVLNVHGDQCYDGARLGEVIDGHGHGYYHDRSLK